MLFGAPGAGKSVLANLLIDHSQKDEPRTFILDLGGSYRQITEKHGGCYLQMQFCAKAGGNSRQSFRINPFVLHPTPDNLQFLFTLFLLLLANAGYEPSVGDDRELYEAVESMYVFSPSQRTLRNLAHGLPPHLGTVLRPWIADGQYGSVFDNVEDTLTFSKFQTFDFQGMDELYPQLLEPLLFYIFQRISQIVYDPALLTSPKDLWADEVWRFLSNGTARQYLVAAGKTWRKHKRRHRADHSIRRRSAECWRSRVSERDLSDEDPAGKPGRGPCQLSADVPVERAGSRIVLRADSKAAVSREVGEQGESAERQPRSARVLAVHELALRQQATRGGDP